MFCVVFLFSFFSVMSCSSLECQELELQKWFKHYVFTRKKVVKVHKLNKVVLKN